MARKKTSNSALTLIAIIVIAVSIPVTALILQSGNLDFRFQAFDSDIPKDVQVTDVDHESIQVSWVTDKPVVGGIQIVDDIRPPILEDEETSYHMVTITGLDAGGSIEFNLLSDAESYGNQGVPYIAATSSFGTTDTNNFLIYGQVFSEDGFTFQQEGLIVLRFSKSGIVSQPVSTTLNEAGGYQLNLKGLKNSSLTSNFPYQGEVDVEATIYIANTEEGAEPTTKKYTVNFLSTRQIPNIFLGDAIFDVIPGVDGS